jgi:hypothetical protein
MFMATSVAPEGIWLPAQSQGVEVDFKCAWESVNNMGTQQFYSSWMQASKFQMQMTDAMTPLTQSPKSSQHSDTMSDGSSSESRGQPETSGRKVQSAARAAKRQRGRERRKMYKANAKLQSQEGDQIEMLVSAVTAEQSSKFEMLAAAVAAELPLVVRSTFIDVDEPSESLSEQVLLPASFFKSTSEIDAWRRDYRRFRMGSHRGAKGEITALASSPEFTIPHQSSVCSSSLDAAKAA